MRDGRRNAEQLIERTREFAGSFDGLRFEGQASYVYNPLDYAREPHEEYLSLYGKGRKRVLFVGMNPGPWGMAQTGVPFGEIVTVRDWLGIEGHVGSPERLHPSRPILGFDVKKSEASGRRLWRLMRDRFGSPGEFFREHFVTNYCPLLFFTEGGANLTPDKLPKVQSEPLLDLCDEYMLMYIEAFEPEWLIGVGKFAERRMEAVVRRIEHAGKPRVAGILHPSPANPRANRGWDGQAQTALEELGVWRPAPSA